jgi:hypothetical protein
MHDRAPVVVVVPRVVVVELDVEVDVDDEEVVDGAVVVVVVAPGRFEGWASALGFRTWIALHRANPAGIAPQTARCSTATALGPLPVLADPIPVNDANTTPVTATRTATGRHRLDRLIITERTVTVTLRGDKGRRFVPTDGASETERCWKQKGVLR